MNTSTYTIFINASREKVWNTMLGKETYQEWTKIFNETSSFEGDWSEGSKILFYGSDENGNKGGMVSRIAKNIPFEHVSIQHLGTIENGVEKPWEGAGEGFENYTFTDKDGGTQLDVEMTGLPDSFVEMMNSTWPKALEVLKGLAEK